MLTSTYTDKKNLFLKTHLCNADLVTALQVLMKYLNVEAYQLVPQLPFVSWSPSHQLSVTLCLSSSGSSFQFMCEFLVEASVPIYLYK